MVLLASSGNMQLACPTALLGKAGLDSSSRAFCAQAPSGCLLFQKEPAAGISLSVSLTFYHILLVVAVIVTVSGAVVDVKTMDGSVVIAGWDILQRTGKQKSAEISVLHIVPGEEQLP